MPSADRAVALYSLDAIISVGYRVKSKQGIQFRIWATQTLRDHLLRGYTLNEKRLRERGLDEVEQAVDRLANTLRLVLLAATLLQCVTLRLVTELS